VGCEKIGEGLGVPVRGLTKDEAQAHFDWMALFVALDNPTSSAITRETLGWLPREADLMTDMRENGYFAWCENLRIPWSGGAMSRRAGKEMDLWPRPKARRELMWGIIWLPMSDGTGTQWIGVTGSNMPVFVTGYHGCHIDVANDIVSGAGFRPSENGYDWLGAGIYFWEDGPSRAAEWARYKFGDSGTVVKANISLEHCLNLLDTAHFERMEQSYLGIVRTSEQLGLAVPKNTRKLHELDYVVIETYCWDAVASGGNAFQTVRGCFPEGKPLYAGSKILRETHIQVSVRDRGCISEVAVVH
jgi:hypothetical protein